MDTTSNVNESEERLVEQNEVDNAAEQAPDAPIDIKTQNEIPKIEPPEEDEKVNNQSEAAIENLEATEEAPKEDSVTPQPES